MWNKGVSIVVLTLLSFLSCKKDNEFDFDREIDLDTDTAIYIYSSNVLADTDDTKFFIEIEMGQFTGVESAKAYPVNAFELSAISEAYGVILTFSGQKRETKIPISSYSSIFVLDENSIDWYDMDYQGLNLNRYLHQIEDDPNKNAAFYFYKEEEDGTLETRFISKDQSKIFGNSREEKMDGYYAIEREPNPSILGRLTEPAFYSILDETMDVLINSTEVVGQKSITFFNLINEAFVDGNPYLDPELAPLLDKALQNNIQLNFILNGKDQGWLQPLLAAETGGFFGDSYESADLTDLTVKRIVGSTVLVQNLNDLLSNNVATQKVTITVDQINGVNFITGSVQSIEVVFCGYRVVLTVIVP